MPFNHERNVILKEVWRIDEKLNVNEQISDNEKEFYNKNLETIKNYYAENNSYWKTKKIIN